MNARNHTAFSTLLIATSALCLLTACTRGASAAQTQPPKGQDFEAAGRLDRVLALRDPMIAGEISTYYTPGYEKHARDLQRFLSGERLFAKKELGVDVPLTLAVFDTRQWSEAEKQLPYGIPSVSSKPYVALMPASWADAKGFFPRKSEIDPAVVKAVEARGVDWTQVNSQSGDLIGAHEVGHVVVDLYGIVPGTRWLNEMLASYVMYAYLQTQRRDLLWLWPVALAETHWRRPLEHVSLDDFESLYLHILTANSPSDNYGWYQGQFYDQIEKVYAQKGNGFLKEVRAAFPPGPRRFALGNAVTLRRLEKISPGFIAWAHAMDATPKLVAHQ